MKKDPYDNPYMDAAIELLGEDIHPLQVLDMVKHLRKLMKTNVIDTKQIDKAIEGISICLRAAKLMV